MNTNRRGFFGLVFGGLVFGRLATKVTAPTIPTMEFKPSSASVFRTLKADYAPDIADDLNSVHDLDSIRPNRRVSGKDYLDDSGVGIERELQRDFANISKEITREINRQLVRDVARRRVFVT